MRKIMLLEPNPYHGEVLPGLVKYFEDLDYVVDVYMREEVINDNPFCRYNIRGDITGYSLSNAKELLSSNNIGEYDFLFLSSMERCENGVVVRFLDEIGFLPRTKYGVLGMYHTNFLIQRFSDYQMQNQNRLFFISEFQTIGFNYVNVLSPIYYGTNLVRYRKRKKKINLLVVGSGMDIPMLQQAYWKLSFDERKKLEIRYIGRGKESKPNKLLDYLHVVSSTVREWRFPGQRKCKDFVDLGEVCFDQMYSEIEQSDYILVLLDPELQNHRHYISSSTSGIRQLILGFSKISIIHEKIARRYEIGDECCIGFISGKLHVALKEAIYMKQDEYIHMVHSVRNERNKMLNKNKNRLEMILNKLEEQELI